MGWIKYLKKEHFDGLLQSGSVRVGTLKDFKEGEHGEMVADSMEGSKRYSAKNIHLTHETLKSSGHLQSLFKVEEPFDMSVGTLSVTIEEPDFYIFSLAQGYNEEDHKAWYEKQDYDTTYKLIAPNVFFRKITRELNAMNPVRFLGLFEVHYYDEQNGMDYLDPKTYFPAFSLKDYDGFSSQKEIRAVWQPIKNDPIFPLNLNVFGLSNYIEFNNSITKHLTNKD